MPSGSSSSSEPRLRLWLERGASGYWLRVVKLAGASACAHERNQVESRLHAMIHDFRGEDGQRIGLRVLLAPADAWIQEPRSCS